MKKIYCLFIFFIWLLQTKAQIADSAKFNQPVSFKLFSRQMNKQFEEEENEEKKQEQIKSGKKQLQKKEHDGPKERWKRLEYFYSKHLDKNGNMFNYVQQDNDALKQLQLSVAATEGNWGFVGPFDTYDNFDFTNQDGIGRVNSIAFIDADTWLIGTAGGGLWKTDVGGVYLPGVPPYDKPWTPLTDNNAVLSVSGIAVKPSAPNKIYILTGDGDHSANDSRNTEGQFPAVPSIGILKTTDGGTTWVETTLKFGRDELVSAHKLLMSPANANTMYAATSKGLFITTDGWATYKQYLKGENVWDVEIHPTDNNIIYVSTTKQIYKSTTATFSAVDITAGLTGLDAGTQRINIAVSAAAPDNLYVISANSGRGLEGVYLSSNKGTSFIPVLDGHTLNIMAHDGDEGIYKDGQSDYDMAFAVDPNNANKIMVGGLGMWVSYTAGISWVHLCGEDDVSDTYVHADIHTIEFNPYSNAIVTGTDGGLWATSGNGNIWEKRCAGLAITQFYHFDVNTASSYFAGEIIGGAQDNGVMSNSVAALLSSGDAYNAVNFEKQQRGGDGFNTFSGSGDFLEYRYTDIQNGKLYLHTKDPVFNGWGYTEITPAEVYSDGEEYPNGAWDTPIEPNPNEFQSILAGYEDLYFSNNYGSNWNNIWSKPGPGFIKEISWNKNNGNNVAFYSENGGLVTSNQLYGGIISGNYNWQEKSIHDITGADVPISDIQFTDDAYPNNLVITIPGYTDSVKVFRTMKDSTWKNISYNLPNVPVLSAAVDEFGMYAGTDIGVFFLADKDSVWTYFSKGLPTVPVTQIEVVQDAIGRRVYCSTFGRGIWKSDPAPPKRTTRYYVNYAASGANDGTTWANAFTKVQDAVYKAIPGDTIWVAKGTYYPTSTYAITGGSAARLYTFIIDSNTVMYGGFKGNETSLKQRDLSKNKTELSGDIGVPVTATDNAYHVLTIINSTKNSLIDGFTIRDGYANGSTSYPSLYRGGAVLLAYDSTKAGRPFFKNCFFANNLAAQGGAIYVSQYFKSDTKTSFLKCTFQQNYTYSNGYGERGGAICTDASPASNGPYGSMSFVIDSCVFQYNNSPNGAAIYNDAQFHGNIQYIINQTQFLHNKSITASGYGGGIFNYTDNKGVLKLTLNGCTFLDDDAPNAGGAIYNAGSQFNDDDMQVYVKNCSFDSCSGYAVYSIAGKIFLNADKSTFTNNTGGIAHVGATIDRISIGKITNCTFNNTVTAINLACNNSGSGATNKSASYSIDSCSFTNNSYGLYVYNYSQGQNAKHVQYTLSHSIFTNNTLGAVYNLGSDNSNVSATLRKNTFTNNKGTNGGAIYSNGYQNGFFELYIDSCNFTGNKATTSGGALYNYHIDIVSVSNCNFNNDSAASGGATYNFAQYKNTLYNISYRNCTYTSNVSTGSGGAMFFSNNSSAAMKTDVVKNIFNGNTAANYGGSLYAFTAASGDTLNINIDSCTFNNSTTTLNNTQSHGGAVYLNAAAYMNVNIKHTGFTNNHAKSRGGGIYAQSTTGRNIKLYLNNCNLDNNIADTYGGGICYGDGSSNGKGSLIIDSCTLNSNTASLAQAGISIYHSSGDTLNANFNHCIFDANNTPGYAGALYIGANGTINGTAADCIFTNNTAVTDGGAARIYANQLKYNNFKFKNCLFNNNSAPGHGGAAYIQTDVGGKINSAFDNCVLVNNSSGYGAGLYVSATSSQANISVPVTNCTIANNNATAETGGIYVTRTGTPTVRTDLINTILWNNTDAGTTANHKQAYILGGATGFIKNSLIKDSIPSGFADSSNNQFSDPLFVKSTDVDGADNIFATADDGFAVKNGSPAINAGATVALTTDVTGLARPQGNAYDIGAYEKNGCSVANVTGLSLSNATSCSMQYSWAAVNGATSYEAAYKSGSTGTWISLGDIGNVLTKTITGLTANTAYDFRVRAKNGSGCTGNWTQILNLKTDLYNEPENLSVANITATSAKLKWQAPACGSTVVNYTVRYKPSSSSSWTTADANGTSYNATGLSPSVQYDWKVRANYNGGSSNYTVLGNFTTASGLAIAKNNAETYNTNFSEKDKPSLEQNVPNPFTGKTTINYYLPRQYKSAQIVIVNKSGIIVEFVQLKNSGKGSIIYNAPFMAGIAYNYSLYVNGKLVDTKQMAVLK